MSPTMTTTTEATKPRPRGVIRIADLAEKNACASTMECARMLARDGEIVVCDDNIRALVVLCHRWIGWLVAAELCPDLHGANLRHADLAGANLAGANLRVADLGGAHLKGADLRVADLGGVDLRVADLGDADFAGAYLEGADLGGAYRPEGGVPGWSVDADGRLRRAS